MGGDGQVRCRGKRVQPGGPVVEVALVAAGLPLPQLGEQIVAEPYFEFGQFVVGFGVQGRQLPEEERDARPVRDEEVQRDVQHGVGVGASGAQVEQRPGGRVVDVVAEFGAHGLQRRLDGAGIRAAQVGDRHRVVRHLGQYPLIAVGGDDRAQHVVPGDQPIPRRGQAVGVEFGVAHLDVDMAGDAAGTEGVAAAEQVGGLHVGERERFEAARIVAYQLDLIAAQQVEHGVLVGFQRRQQLGGEHPLRGAVTQAVVLGPQFHPRLGQGGHEVGGGMRLLAGHGWGSSMVGRVGTSATPLVSSGSSGPARPSSSTVSTPVTGEARGRSHGSGPISRS